MALDPGLPITGEIEIFGVPVTAVCQSVTRQDRLPLPDLSPGYRYQKKLPPPLVRMTEQKNPEIFNKDGATALRTQLQRERFFIDDL